MEVEANPQLNYVVTAHKPTAVVKSVVGSFTAADVLNLIVAKSTRLEVYTSTANGLEAVLDVPLYGRITTMELFRPKGKKKDLLFILFERYQVCILEYNSSTRTLDTLASGEVQDTVGRPSDNGQLAVIDPKVRCIILQLYDGMIKVIPLEESGNQPREIKAFNARLEELQIIDIAALHGHDNAPTIAVLYQDAQGARHLRAYEILMKNEDVKPLERQMYGAERLDPGACLLAPLPPGGVLVLGQQSIEYVGPPGSVRRTVPLRPCVLKAWGRIDFDGSRMLLSDHLGLLYVLVVARQDGQVTSLKLEIVGRTSSASSLNYLDAGVVFVGSRQGDSQLIRLHATPPDPSAPNSFVQVLDTWPNLGPIVDFSVIDLDRQGQGQLVCCSGAMSDGSLRVVRNGVGINEQASIELPGIRGIWSLRESWEQQHHKYLVLAFVGETRVLAMNHEDELDEAELPGLDSGSVTLWCGNTASNHLVQVTPHGVRALSGDTGMLESEWRPPAGTLSVASGNATQIVVATGDGTLHILDVSPTGITQSTALSIGEQVACVDITPTEGDGMRSNLIAVGTWSLSVQLYALQAGSLQQVITQPLEGGVIPRSVMMWCFEGVPHLLVGQGDGHLHYWKMQQGTLTDKKKLVLGTKPVLLRPFKGGLGSQQTSIVNSNGNATNNNGGNAAEGVFAASDRPAVLYSSNHKILYANLNENDVIYMAPFNCPSFPDSLAIAKEESLTIGTVDKIQKLHIRTLPLHEQPRRVVHQEDTGTLGVITITNLGMTDEAGFVRVYDASGNMDLRASYPLESGEMGCAITSCKLGEDANTYFVVGTSMALPDEQEPTKGRVLVLQYAQGQLTLVAQREVKGAAYDVLPFQGGRLVSSCNNKIYVYKWTQHEDGKRELQPECSASGHVMSLYMATRGDFVLVGDLMRSMSLYLFKQQPDSQLELRAQDYATNWCTTVAMLDDDTYIASENSFNLIVARKNTESAVDEERGRLEVVGEYHLGEFVNRIRPGSLVVRLPDSELSQVPIWLLGTIDGTINVMASLPPPLFELLERLQDAMRKVVKGIGGLDHARWRSFCNERKESPARKFIDGDLIEMFLDLKPEDAAKVVGFMGSDVTVEEITSKVEELARLH